MLSRIRKGGLYASTNIQLCSSVKLKLTETVKNRLEKTFRVTSSAYNEALSFGLRRFEDLKQNSRYQELLELRRNSNHQAKEYDKEL